LVGSDRILACGNYRVIQVIKWTEAYATGIAEIDKQHKMFFRIVEDFRLSHVEGRGATVYEQVVNLLAAYARGHFGYEESCMHAHNCPMAANNKLEHTQFLRFIERTREQYRLHGYRDHESEELLGTLEDWLTNHIGKVDVHLRDCVSK
jgi:hemerythrin